MDTPKETERINKEGAVEVNVETEDYRKPAGAQEAPPQPEKVVVTHLVEDDASAAKLVEKIQSAPKEAAAETTGKK